MRKLILGTATLMALASPAMADGLSTPTYKAPRPVVPAWTWTGCYMGGHLGGLSSEQGWINQTPGGAFFGQSLGGHDVDHVIGGVQAGCDYQLAGGLVVGVQGDYGWTDAEGQHDSAREFGVAYHSDIKSLASVTGRVGYAWDRALIYVKGGGAWERDNYWASTIIAGTVYTTQDTRTGWTIGVGGEYAFTRHLSGFIEYNYYDFGAPQVGLTPLLPGLRPAFVDLDETTSVVRVGLNIRFGG
jgi:outer membrane immunogenic protein